MTLAEFKAWLEGYCASIKDGAPNAEQWAEIKRRLETVQAIRVDLPFPYVHPVTYPMVAPWGPNPNSTGTIPWLYEHVTC